MTVEDDPAWAEYSKCYDNHREAMEYYRSLPENHPDKGAAYAAVLLAQGALNAAGNKIAPEYKGPG
ncbi:hypothetical protein XH83_15335 [Bradyrhizobium sp. CCBAU 53351]|uniref:hypothetical protein n=1 Tax=Bradyrhizobium sp. CCBAU 53351 TaxID=1325114 RepID=UPI0018876882|nr:hypothetical protein [Bradyrhizobium sp. CCBAU 53351]QOZ76704.1 hypothetical protein XH83_15335 [Bradyrhizobium sp. CCBAU 53351]